MKSSCNVLHSLSASEPKTVKRRPQKKNFQTRKKGITLEHQGKTKHLRKYLVLPGVVSFFPLGTGRFFSLHVTFAKAITKAAPDIPCHALPCINVLGQKVRQGVQPSFPLPLGTTFIHGIRERRELRWLARSGHPSTRCTASGADWIVLPR